MYLALALLAKRGIEQTDYSLGFYSHLFLAPKKNGKWHPIINLPALNHFLSSLHFHMKTACSVMQSFPLGAWCTSIGLEDTFLHLNSGMARPAPPPRSTATKRLPVITGTPSGEVATPVGLHDFTGNTDKAEPSPHAFCSVHAS